MKAPSLTIGIEEEYQIIDPKTGELKSYITQILEDGKVMLKEQIKAELHQSMVEVGTEICRTPAEAKLELIKLRKAVMDLAGKHGLVIAAAGTHPFSAWQTQEITPFERYIGVKNDMGDLALNSELPFSDQPFGGSWENHDDRIFISLYRLLLRSVLPNRAGAMGLPRTRRGGKIHQDRRQGREAHAAPQEGQDLRFDLHAARPGEAPLHRV